MRDPNIAQSIIDQGVKFVTTSAGSPERYTETLKSAGLTVFHVVPSLAAALKAVECGVDGLIVEGGEGGGFKNPRDVVPYAKGISVKASWAADGSSAGWDLEKLLKICMESGYHGFWGIESGMARSDDSASQSLTPDQIWDNESKAVRLTKAAIERVVFSKPSA